MRNSITDLPGVTVIVCPNGAASNPQALFTRAVNSRCQAVRCTGIAHFLTVLVENGASPPISDQ